MPIITMEDGDPEAWVCECGNTPHNQGFYYSDSKGKLLEDAVESNPTFYTCVKCGLIIREDGEIIGKIGKAMTKPLSAPSAEAVEALKREWLDDPSWDIEKTEGFGVYTKELLAFRLETEARNNANRKAELEEKAISLGVPGNIVLAKAFEILEYRIEDLSRRLAKLDS